jgi:hypothetical protein
LTGSRPERPPRLPAKRLVRLNDAQLARLCKRYGAGETVSKLAGEFQVSRSTVSANLKAAGITLRLSPLSPDEAALAVHLYIDGLSMAQVAVASREVVFDSSLVRGVVM